LLYAVISYIDMGIFYSKRKATIYCYLLTCGCIPHQFSQGHPTIQKFDTTYTFSFVLFLRPDSHATKLPKYRQLSVDLRTFQAMKLGYIYIYLPLLQTLTTWLFFIPVL